MIDDSQLQELPDCNTSLTEEESIEGEEFTRYLGNTYLLCSESGGSESSDDETPCHTFVPTWNSTNGFRRQFERFSGTEPDYSSNEK